MLSFNVSQDNQKTSPNILQYLGSGGRMGGGEEEEYFPFPKMSCGHLTCFMCNVLEINPKVCNKSENHLLVWKFDLPYPHNIYLFPSPFPTPHCLQAMKTPLWPGNFTPVANLQSVLYTMSYIRLPRCLPTIRYALTYPSLLDRPLFITFSLLTTKQIISPVTSTREKRAFFLGRRGSRIGGSRS